MPTKTTTKVSKKKVATKAATPARGARVVAKTVAIKTPKPSGSKKTVKREAVGYECFWVNNGPICKTVPELKAAFLQMSDAQFTHHTKNGNDFAAWLENTMGHSVCAAKVRKVKTRVGAARALSVCTDK